MRLWPCLFFLLELVQLSPCVTMTIEYRILLYIRYKRSSLVLKIVIETMFYNIGPRQEEGGPRKSIISKLIFFNISKKKIFVTIFFSRKCLFFKTFIFFIGNHYRNEVLKKFRVRLTKGQCYKTFYHSNLMPFHGHTVILCYKTLLLR